MKLKLIRRSHVISLNMYYNLEILLRFICLIKNIGKNLIIGFINIYVGLLKNDDFQSKKKRQKLGLRAYPPKYRNIVV